jgi:hypothetical protein
VLWYYYSFGHNKFSKLYTLFCYILYFNANVQSMARRTKSVSSLHIFEIKFCISHSFHAYYKPCPCHWCDKRNSISWGVNVITSCKIPYWCAMRPESGDRSEDQQLSACFRAVSHKPMNPKFRSVFRLQCCMHFTSSHLCSMFRPYHPWFDRPNNNLFGESRNSKMDYCLIFFISPLLPL